MQDARLPLGPQGAAALGPPPLHCLQAFEAVSRHRSLAKASGELRLSAAALTQSIAALEERLGLKLVRHWAPNVVLTEAGHQYFHAVQAFAHHLRDGLYERLPHGRTALRVSAPQALARLWLAPRLGGFAQQHPRIDVVLTSTAALEPLKDGGVDIGLRYGGPVEADLLAIPLWADVHVAAAAPALAARADGLAPGEIARQLPLLEHPVASWRPWLAAIDPGLALADPLLACNDLHLAIEAACQGLGVVIAPARLLTAKFARGELQRVSRHSTPGRTYQAVLWRDRTERAPVVAFLQWLSGEVGDS